MGGRMTTRPLTSPSLSSLRLVIMLPLIPLLRPSSCRLASSFLCLSSPILRPKASGSEGEEHTRRKKGDECETNRSEPGDERSETNRDDEEKERVEKRGKELMIRATSLTPLGLHLTHFTLFLPALRLPHSPSVSPRYTRLTE